MTERLKRWVGGVGKLRESQAGFREGRGTSDHVFVLNSLIGNKLKREKGRVYATFIDFKTALDANGRKILIDKLGKRGVKGRMLEMIRGIYRMTRNEIITNEGISEGFETGKGVRQGCLLSPILFKIFIEDSWEERNEGEW